MWLTLFSLTNLEGGLSKNHLNQHQTIVALSIVKISHLWACVKDVSLEASRLEENLALE